MFLINVTAEKIEMPDERWEQLLNAARRNGWEPLGTYPPPRDLRQGEAPGEWDKAYLPVVGQEVSTSDAAELARALRKANENPAIVEFCLRGGFLLCPGGFEGLEVWKPGDENARMECDPKTNEKT